jgi:GNAT superfamily N-acetyltransferase
MNLFKFMKKSVPVPLPLPQVVIRKLRERLHGSFVAPNLWIDVECFNHDCSAVVAHVNYGVSPLRDRIYIDGLEVEPQYRRQGYARSLLLTIAQQCSDPGQLMPVTALHELGSSNSFWQSLRNGRVPGLVVTTDVRVGEMDAEKQRWQINQIWRQLNTGSK